MVPYKIYKVEDFDRPFYIQDFKTCEHLIIAFSGYGQNFEWFGSMRKYERNYNFSKFWLRDLSKAYWHGKLPGIDYGVKALSEFINEKIKESQTKKVMALGLSMGGYAALLFGCLCNVDMVLSFSGQTYLSDRRRTKYKLYEKWNGLNINENDIDLKILFEEYNYNNKTIYKLFYGESNNADKNYAHRIMHHRGVELYPVCTSRHNSVRPAIKMGYVDKFIKDFLET